MHPIGELQSPAPIAYAALLWSAQCRARRTGDTMRHERVGIGRRARWLYSATGVLITVAAVATVVLYQPLPPRTIVMTTGTPGSAYEVFGQRYKAILARSNVELRLMPSAGAVENLKRLNDPRSGVSVGFVEGGLTDAKQSPDLMSLGTMFYEPLWLFYRGRTLTAQSKTLQGKKLSIGLEGSATRALALQLLALIGIDQDVVQLMSLGDTESAAALQKGDI